MKITAVGSKQWARSGLRSPELGEEPKKIQTVFGNYIHYRINCNRSLVVLSDVSNDCEVLSCVLQLLE